MRSRSGCYGTTAEVLKGVWGEVKSGAVERIGRDESEVLLDFQIFFPSRKEKCFLKCRGREERKRHEYRTSSVIKFWISSLDEKGRTIFLRDYLRADPN